FAAVRLDDVFDDRQTETCPASFARARPIYAKKSFKDSLVRFRGNSRAVIAHPNLYFSVRQSFGPDSDLAFVWSIFDGVFNQVVEDLLEAFRVCLRFKIGRNLVEQLGAFVDGPSLEVFKDPLDGLVQFNGLEA